MSDRLLKESDVLKAIDKRVEELSKDPVFIRKNGIIDIMGVKKYILAIPSVDRPQGEWKHLKGDEWLCSNCGYVVWTEGSWEHPLKRGKDYCEHCGAKMAVVVNKR